jgi:transposase
MGMSSWFHRTSRESDERVAVRQGRAKPLVDDLKVWMRQQRDRLAPSHDLAKAIN